MEDENLASKAENEREPQAADSNQLVAQMDATRSRQPDLGPTNVAYLTHAANLLPLDHLKFRRVLEVEQKSSIPEELSFFEAKILAEIRKKDWCGFDRNILQTNTFCKLPFLRVLNKDCLYSNFFLAKICLSRNVFHEWTNQFAYKKRFDNPNCRFVFFVSKSRR